MQEKNDKKNIILITGVSGGLGSALFNLLVKEDVHIIGVARNIGRLEALKNSIVAKPSCSFELISIDLKEIKSVKDLSEEIITNWGRVNILVHCAAISAPMTPSNVIFESNFKNVFFNNVLSTKYIISYIDPLLRASSDSKAIFVDDSMTGRFTSTYSSSKAAARELATCYQKESERIGPKVYLFNPKPMKTNIRKNFFPGEKKKGIHSCLSQAKILKAIIHDK